MRDDTRPAAERNVPRPPIAGIDESDDTADGDPSPADVDWSRDDPVDNVAGDAAVRLRGVVKEYDSGGDETVRALKGVDFAAHYGEFVAVMGPSGSGKSTMLNVLGLLDDPTSGSVELDDDDVTDLSDREATDQRRRSIGFVFQNFFLIPTLTAVENVEVPTLFGDADGDRARAKQLLSRVGLGDRITHRPTELSGGQKQRVAIARGLVNAPDVLLADEPTGNLDRDTGATILDEFGRIKREDQVAVIAVTHDEQVSRFADRTVSLVDGQFQ